MLLNKKLIIITLLLSLNLLANTNIKTLKKGWSLTTLPSNYLENLPNTSYVWYFDTQNNNWKIFSKNILSYGEYPKIETTSTSKAYWVLSYDDFNLSFENSTVDNFDFNSLEDGWHMLGSYDGISNFTTISEDTQIIWKYIDNNWNVKGFKANIISAIEDNSLDTFDTIEPKSGFWLLKSDIVNNLPSSEISIDNLTPHKLETVQFSSVNTDADDDTLTYLWNFGDNTISTQASVEHNYSTAGTYDVNFTVTDAKGGSVTTNSTITVQDIYLNPKKFPSEYFPCTLSGTSDDATFTYTFNYVNDTELSIDINLKYSFEEPRNDSGLNIQDANIDMNSASLQWDGNKYSFEVIGNNLTLLDYSDSHGYFSSGLSKFKLYGEYYPYSDFVSNKNIGLLYFTGEYYGNSIAEYSVSANDNKYDGLTTYNNYFNNFDTEFNSLVLEPYIEDDNSDYIINSTCVDELNRFFR